MMKLTGLCGAVASLAVSDSLFCQVDAARLNTKPQAKKQLRRLATATAGGLIGQGIVADASCTGMCEEGSKALAAIVPYSVSADMTADDQSQWTKFKKSTTGFDDLGGALFMMPGTKDMVETQLLDLSLFEEEVSGAFGWTGLSKNDGSPKPDVALCAVEEDTDNSGCTEAKCKAMCQDAKNGKGEECTHYFHATDGEDDVNICALFTSCEGGESFADFEKALAAMGERRLLANPGKAVHGLDTNRVIKAAKKGVAALASEKAEGKKNSVRRLNDPDTCATYTKDGKVHDLDSGALSARNLAPAVALFASVVGVASAVAGM